MDILEKLKIATETPPFMCVDHKDHEYKHIMHADGREFYSNYYECKKCQVVAVVNTRREGLNKLLWE